MATIATPVATAADIAAVEDVLLDVYVSTNLESQIQEEVQLLEFFDEVTEYTDSVGLQASVPLKVGRTGGIGARAIGQELQLADHQKKAKATYTYKNLYVQAKVEGPVVARMKTDRQSVVREIDDEISGSLEDFNRDLCRQLHGFGDAALTTAGLPVMASPSTTVLLGTGNYHLIERGFLWAGMRLDIGSLVDVDLDASGVQITSVTDNPAAPAIVLDTAVTVTASSHLFIHDNAKDNVSNEINGLGTIVADDTEIGGIDPTDAGSEYWKAVVEDNGGTNRALSLALMNDTNRGVRQRGGKVSDVLGSLGMQQAYYNLLQSQVRFNGDTGLAAGGVEGPKFNNVTFHGDPDALPNRIYFLVKKALQMYSAGPVAWQNQTTGGNILAWSQNYDAFVARAAKYCQVGTNRRRSLGLLADITEP
jgi:hypothetical protein